MVKHNHGRRARTLRHDLHVEGNRETMRTVLRDLPGLDSQLEMLPPYVANRPPCELECGYPAKWRVTKAGMTYPICHHCALYLWGDFGTGILVAYPEILTAEQLGNIILDLHGYGNTMILRAPMDDDGRTHKRCLICTSPDAPMVVRQATFCAPLCHPCLSDLWTRIVACAEEANAC